MNRNLEEITEEVIRLPNLDRLKLVKTLLLLDDNKTDDNVENRWQEEISKRVLSVEKGEAVGFDFDESIQNIRNRLSQ